MHISPTNPFTTQRKPPFKRRKLTSSSSPSTSLLQPLDFLKATSTLSTTMTTPTQNVQKAYNYTCTSCHRTLSAKPGQIIFCARCTSPTCPICSRTCTSRLPSLPPTPLLSYTPSLPSTPEPSPRRAALSLATMSNVNGYLGVLGGGVNLGGGGSGGSGGSGTATPPTLNLPLPPTNPNPEPRTPFQSDNTSSTTPRRRKHTESEDEHPSLSSSSNASNQMDSTPDFESESENHHLAYEVPVPGCGRLVCRSCSFESPQSGATTCYDCYGCL
ncbi:hypothetical protein JAAARDRAFT_34905 [Jaapia argillacea MUCL 33604]|uniref:Uncharacterized protein n=1 Tax=Jaapia argillacea MUCL 33604 TaxID=933084 RepID=A0A067PTG5_9AGAM|nr:hypothetical protein JAAARDRAFT_34905 [Jaapia argillacea MUCL 33604]